ncbi:MAG TPA: adenosylhomocysteinase [Candidatus Thermoplasmatota archaeon]|nr:adenosylhomocysteinase [Candidatus Thermoplasmatota archaeon]
MAKGKVDVDEGGLKIEWARDHMPVLARLVKASSRVKPLKGVSVGMALHLEAKTAVLVLALRDAGAEVRVAGCNPLSTDDTVARALVERHGVSAYGHRGESTKEYYKALDDVLDGKPQVVVDDGADLISVLHTRRRKDLKRVVGANEETTTGVVRLKAMEADHALKIPVIDVNNAQMKHLFDNRYGTGQSAFDGIFTATNLLIAGKCVVVAGYGWCGRGIAMRADGLGARVIVTEVDPVKAVEAVMDGFEVMPMARAVEEADFLISATGVRDIVRPEHLRSIKDGCVLANAGHFNVEISPETLAKAARSVKRARAGVDAYTLEGGRKVYLLSDGRLVNLAAGQGHPVEIMDMSFAVQYLCALRLWKARGTMRPGVHRVPPELDLEVAQSKLDSLGTSIDTLTGAQRRYIESWNEGT